MKIIKIAASPLQKVNPENLPTTKQIQQPKNMDAKQKAIMVPVTQQIRNNMPEFAEYLKNPKIQPAIFNMFQNMYPNQNPSQLTNALHMFNNLYSKQEKQEAQNEQITENKADAQEAKQEMTNPTNASPKKASNNNWYKQASRTVKEHIRDVMKADLNSPIFITENLEIIDGAHRTAKAYLMDKKIRGIILTQDEINKALLPKDSNYVGQIYRDDNRNEYSVTKLIELYKNKPTKIYNPKDIINNSRGVWGKVSIIDIMKQVQKQMRNE